MFQVQRYEGASTIFGPHTLTIYLNQFSKLAEHIKKVFILIINDNSPFIVVRRFCVYGKNHYQM